MVYSSSDQEIKQLREKQRKTIKEETRDDSRSYKREEQKKGGRTKQPPFIMYVRPVMASQLDNHDGISNIKIYTMVKQSYMETI